MSPRLDCDVSDAVWRAVREESERTGDSVAHVVNRNLASALGLDRHSMYQVSTTSALVQGVFRGAVTVGELRRRGDFGIGTYDSLDGELVMLDGDCYRVGAGGSVRRAEDGWTVPFAVVTRFVPDRATAIGPSRSLDELEAALDGFRPSQNLFVGLRADGRFASLMLRAVCRAAPGEDLVRATEHQSEFTAEGLEGSLVGFWSPPYATAVSVPARSRRLGIMWGVAPARLQPAPAGPRRLDPGACGRRAERARLSPH